MGSQTLYRRHENTTTQTPAVAQLQLKSGEIWGSPGRWGVYPCVRAYFGQLASGQKGVEFATVIPHDPKYSSPWEAHWVHPYTSGVLLNSQGFAVIAAKIVKIV
ncbi:MAG: hypothetical protein ABSD31_02300 [Candidatus Binataceae bacterium]|jgi:hypothetical protein